MKQTPEEKAEAYSEWVVESEHRALPGWSRLDYLAGYEEGYKDAKEKYEAKIDELRAELRLYEQKYWNNQV